MKPKTLFIVILVAALSFSITPSLAEDKDPPTIEMITTFPVVIYEGMDTAIEANVMDASGVKSVIIAYDEDGTGRTASMEKVSLYRYQWVYQSSDIGQRTQMVVTILNITATDIYSNWITETYDNTTITVKKEDIEGPEIELGAMPLYTESEDNMVIRASVSDPSDVASVLLSYEAGGTWHQKEMQLNNETDHYEAIIGPFETDTAVRYYVNATDGSPRANMASTLESDGGDMRSFVASFRKRFDGSVMDSSYMQVDELHRYRMNTSRDTIDYEGYVFNLELSQNGILTGNVSFDDNGTLIHIQDINLEEKNNVIITDESTKDGIAYDFNLKYVSYNPDGPYAEIEINPRQSLVFEGYSIYMSVKKVAAGQTYTFKDGEGGQWQVNVTAESGYETVTKTFTSRNQFKELYMGGKRDLQIFYLGEERASGEILRYLARIRVYKFQPPVFEISSDVPTGSPSGLASGQIVYNVYAEDNLNQTVVARNLAGSRAYDIDLTYTNVSGSSFLVIYQGELTSSVGPVYTVKEVGNKTVKYYLTYGTLTRSFELDFSSEIQVRESATFDVLLSYKDAHDQFHQVRVPVQFLIYPSRSDLTVTKSLKRDPLYIGKDSQASIVIENDGGSPALDITVIDNTPPNLISDFEIWHGEIAPGQANRVSLSYSIKPTTITKPGLTSYGFVTVYWKGVCHKAGVRNDAYALHTQDFYFTALGPHLDFISFQTDRPIVEKDGQQMIFINVGERVKVTATVKNDGNKVGKNLSLAFPGFFVESTNFPMGTDVDVGQYFSFTATVVAVNQGNYPFRAKITHYDEIPDLGNVYEAYSKYILAQTYLSPILVQFIDAPAEISAGEVVTITLSIRNIGNSPVEDATVLLSLTSGLALEYGTYLIWEGTLGALQSELVSIQVSGRDFGPNKITATASGKDIPDIDYELDLKVLSPHIEIERGIDSEYLLSREEYWSRSSEIRSWVTLRLSNLGNDEAVGVAVSETLPQGILSFDNLTFGSNLIVWGESGEISLAPNETLTLRYPIWSHKPGHYVFGAAVATYTNPKHISYESESSTLELWVLYERPFLVPEGPVAVLGANEQPITGPVCYNDTVTFMLGMRNIGNGKAKALDLGGWIRHNVTDLECVVLNTNEIKAALGGGVDPTSLLQVPVRISVREDVPLTGLYNVTFPISYSDEDGRNYSQTMRSQLLIRPTQLALQFTTFFAREHVSPGEAPELRIQVTNTGDTDLFDVRALVDLPVGISLNHSSNPAVLRASEKATITVELNPVTLPEGQVYESFQGFVTRIAYRSFRGEELTPSNGRYLEIKVAKPFIEVTRSITSEVLLARNDEWPFSSMILENVTLSLRNTAQIEAKKVKIVEDLPEGLYTLESLGTSQIVWGEDGKLTLGPGETMNLTYPVWSFNEGKSAFEPAVVSYLDDAGHEFGSYSSRVNEVITVLARPCIVWDGEIASDPSGSLTYNDTVDLELTLKNIGNKRSSALSLSGWSSGDLPEGWVLLNPGELDSVLSQGLLAGSTKRIPVRLRVLKDITVAGTSRLDFTVNYSDDSSYNYTTTKGVDLFIRPPAMSVSPDVFKKNNVLMPGEIGFTNITLANVGDTDLFNLTLDAKCPEGVSVSQATSLDVLSEGVSSNASIVFEGISIGGAVGKVYNGINLTVSYVDFRGDLHVKRFATINLTVKRPLLTFRRFDAKDRTRLARKYSVLFVIGNDGTSSAGEVRIQLGELTEWLGDMSVEGGVIEGSEVVINEGIPALGEVQVTVEGKVLQKGEFKLHPLVAYADAVGNSYELVSDPVAVKSGEKIIKMILPFLLWAAVGAAIGGVYYYETRIAEKMKGHQLGSLANSIITHVDATQAVPPLIPFKKKKLSLAEFSYLLSLYLTRAKATGVKKADKTTFIITHPQSRLVPGQDFKNLFVIRDAYMLLAEMIQNRVKSSGIVPPTFLVQGFKVGISDIAYILSLAVSRLRSEGSLPRTIKVPSSTKISAGEARKEEKTDGEETGALIEEPIVDEAKEGSAAEGASEVVEEAPKVDEAESESKDEK